MAQRLDSDGWLLDPGQEVDHFRVLRPLGRGGMAQVFLARDTHLGRHVALKLIQPGALDADGAAERFLFEARATARFAHPHIVTIHHVGQHEGRPYVALEYLEGQTLRGRLAGTPPAVGEIARLGLAVAKALVAAHAEGIVHRDLKPENVMLGNDGRLRVLDFGLARAVTDDLDSRAALEVTLEPDEAAALQALVSRSHGLRGTPTYMAPEQWREEQTTPAADVWALGVMLFEMATGARPYAESEGTLIKLAMAVTAAAEPAPTLEAEIPEALAELVTRCLSKDPAQRPSTEEVASALERLLLPLGATEVDAAPFRGLLPFDERHAAFFFGREAEVAAFVERLRDEPLLPVVGPSGAGKSSFVRAGVIPRLREQGRLSVIDLRPGTRPLRVLAERLAASRRAAVGASQRPPPDSGRGGGAEDEEAVEIADQLRKAPELLGLLLESLAEERGGNVLLLVDQLEEVFTLTDDQAEQQVFVQAVAAAAADPTAPVRVVYTLREEFLGRLAEREAAPRGVTVLRRPGPDTLAQVLIRQAAAAGLSFEDETLARQMVGEVTGEVACLPLLQFAGERLWEGRDEARRLLLRETHEQMGGVAGVLAQHADGVLAGFTPGQEEAARSILLRLVTADGTRQVLARSTLTEGLPAAAATVVDRLVTARLLTVRKAGGDEEVVELAHEALVSTWRQLRRWIEESREELVFLEEAGQAADLWDRRGRRNEELWDEAALRDAAPALDHCSTEVPDRVRRFLQAGREIAVRTRRRRRWLTAAGVALLALIAVGALIAAAAISHQKRQADEQRSLAEARRAEADTKRAEAQLAAAKTALEQGNPLEARARLRLSLQTRDSIGGRALWWRLERTALLWRWRRVQTNRWFYELAFSPDSRTLAGAGSKALVLLFDTATGTSRALRGAQGSAWSTSFTPDGRSLAVAYRNGELWLWNLLHRRSRALTSLGFAADKIRFSHDGRSLAAISEDRFVRVYRRSDWKVRLKLPVDDMPHEIRLGPDGRWISAGLSNGKLYVWEQASGKPRWIKRAHVGQVRALDISPDSAQIASAGVDKIIRLWRADSGTLDQELRGHVALVDDVSFDPRGDRLASGAIDRTVRLWDLKTGRQSEVLWRSATAIRDVAFSPDGKYLAASDWGGELRVWDATKLGSSGVQVTSREEACGGSCAASSLDLSPDSRILAAGSNNGPILLFDVASGALRRVLRGHTRVVRQVLFGPRGERLVSLSQDRTVRIWDLRSGEAPTVLPLRAKSQSSSLAVTPDGRHLIVGGHDLQLWDLKTGTHKELRGHTDAIQQMVVSGDGRLLASAGQDGTIRLWSLPAGRPHGVLQTEHPGTVNSVAFAPTGQELLSTASDRKVRRWDLKRRTSQVVALLPSVAFPVKVHPSGRWFAARGERTPPPVEPQRRQRRPARGRSAPDRPDRRFCLQPRRTVAGDPRSTRHPAVVALAFRASSLACPGIGWIPAEVLTHRGWQRLDGPATQAAAAKWRHTVERRGRRAATGGGALCLQAYDDTLQLWDLRADQLRFQRLQVGSNDLTTAPGGCLVLTSAGQVIRHDTGGARVLVRGDARAVAASGGRILVATGAHVVVLDAAGHTLQRLVIDRLASAVGQVGDELVVGYQDGAIERLTRPGAARRPGLEDTPSAAVTRLIAGPRGTLFAGFTDGAVGMWSLEDGRRLHLVSLRGPVAHLRYQGGKLHVATETGDTLLWDLRGLSQDRCKLLGQVWREVPVVWEDGRPVRRAPPKEHPCAPR